MDINANEVPPPAPENIDAAAAAFDAAKPSGTRIAGLAIIYQTLANVFWSVNYEVDSQSTFPVPKIANCVTAKAHFQSSAPGNVHVHQAQVCTDKPGGLVLSKWQVTYSVNLRAAGSQRTKNLKKQNSLKLNNSKFKTVKFVKSSKTHAQELAELRPQAFNPTRVLNDLAKKVEEQVKVKTQAKEKFGSIYISNKNVFDVKISDVNKWFSTKKKNFTFGLRRILTKKRKATKCPVPITNPGEEIIIPKHLFEEIPDPKRVYINLSICSQMRHIAQHCRDKLHLAQALHHVSACKQEKYPPHILGCMSATRFLSDHDITSNVTIYPELLDEVCQRYRIDKNQLKVTTMIPIKNSVTGILPLCR